MAEYCFGGLNRWVCRSKIDRNMGAISNHARLCFLSLFLSLSLRWLWNRLGGRPNYYYLPSHLMIRFSRSPPFLSIWRTFTEVHAKICHSGFVGMRGMVWSEEGTNIVKKWNMEGTHKGRRARISRKVRQRKAHFPFSSLKKKARLVWRTNENIK